MCIRDRPKVVYENPLCPRCGRRMESMGRGQGYRCRRCGLRRRDAGKRAVVLKREVREGLYLPPPRAQRHLTKPLQRYGRENRGFNGCLIDRWHYP